MIVVRGCLLIVFPCGKSLWVGFMLHDTAGCCSFIFVGRLVHWQVEGYWKFHAIAMVVVWC